MLQNYSKGARLINRADQILHLESIFNLDSLHQFLQHSLSYLMVPYKGCILVDQISVQFCRVLLYSSKPESNQGWFASRFPTSQNLKEGLPTLLKVCF